MNTESAKRAKFKEMQRAQIVKNCKEGKDCKENKNCKKRKK